MAKRDSVKFFLRFLLLTIITFVAVTLSLFLVTTGEIGAIVGVLLVIINVFFLLFYLIISITKLLKHLFDKKREYFDFMYIVNVLFTILITGVFLFFYFILIVGAMVILLPFLA